MGWRFRKTIKRGPFRHTITKKGVGSSIGFWGFRIGITPSNVFYFSLGIPGTGLYYIKHFKSRKNSQGNKTTLINENQNPGKNNQNDEWWKEQIK